MKNKLVLRADLKLSRVGGVTNIRRVPESGGFHTESSVSEGPLPGPGDGEQTCARGTQGLGWSAMVEEVGQIPGGMKGYGSAGDVLYIWLNIFSLLLVTKFLWM